MGPSTFKKKCQSQPLKSALFSQAINPSVSALTFKVIHNLQNLNGGSSRKTLGSQGPPILTNSLTQSLDANPIPCYVRFQGTPKGPTPRTINLKAQNLTRVVQVKNGIQVCDHLFVRGIPSAVQKHQAWFRVNVPRLD